MLHSGNQSENSWMALGDFSQSEGQAWNFLCYASLCHSNDAVTVARFMDG